MSHDAHIDDEALSLYAMNRIDNEDELANIEEHLLVCITCQHRLRFEDTLISGLRALTDELQWSRTHATDDGEVNAYVYRAVEGHYVGHVVGAGVDCGAWRVSASDAQTWCEDSFREMSPSMCVPTAVVNVRNMVSWYLLCVPVRVLPRRFQMYGGIECGACLKCCL
jgi:hypothetical protein